MFEYNSNIAPNPAESAVVIPWDWRAPHGQFWELLVDKLPLFSYRIFVFRFYVDSDTTPSSLVEDT